MTQKSPPQDFSSQSNRTESPKIQDSPPTKFSETPKTDFPDSQLRTKNSESPKIEPISGRTVRPLSLTLSSRSYRLPPLNIAEKSPGQHNYTPTKLSTRALSLIDPEKNSEYPHSARTDRYTSGTIKSVSESRSPQVMVPQRRPSPAVRANTTGAASGMLSVSSDDILGNLPKSARNYVTLDISEIHQISLPLTARPSENTRAYMQRNLPRKRGSIDRMPLRPPLTTGPPPDTATTTYLRPSTSDPLIPPTIFLVSSTPLKTPPEDFRDTQRSPRTSCVIDLFGPPPSGTRRGLVTKSRTHGSDQSPMMCLSLSSPSLNVSPWQQSPSSSPPSPSVSPRQRSPVQTPREQSPVHGSSRHQSLSPRQRSPVQTPRERSPVHGSPQYRSPGSRRSRTPSGENSGLLEAPRSSRGGIGRSTAGALKTMSIKPIEETSPSTLDDLSTPSHTREDKYSGPLYMVSPKHPEIPFSTSPNLDVPQRSLTSMEIPTGGIYPKPAQRARSLKGVTQMIKSPRTKLSLSSPTFGDPEKEKGKMEFLYLRKIGEIVSPRGREQDTPRSPLRDPKKEKKYSLEEEMLSSPKREKKKMETEKSDSQFLDYSSKKDQKRRSFSSSLEERKRLEEKTLSSTSGGVKQRSKGQYPKKNKSRSKAKKSPQGMYFGVPLSDSYSAAAACGHLHFAFLCITFIELHGLETEGLFRVSGDAGVIQEWIKSIDSGSPLVFDENASVHDACGILKSYLMKLPERLIPLEYTKQLSIDDTDEQYLEKITAITKTLPKINQILLLKLLGLLHRVSSNSHINKMTTKNLSTCWSLIVFQEPAVYETASLSAGKEGDKMEMNAQGKALLEATSILNRALVVMIENHVLISKHIKKMIM